MDRNATAVLGPSSIDKENWPPLSDSEISANGDPSVLSQNTDYGEDISALILQVEETPYKKIPSKSPPNSDTTSSSSLGKRTASDLSEPSNPASNRPAKICKSNSTSNLSSKKINPHTPYIIAYSSAVQQHFAVDLPYGVQYELARLVSLRKLSYENITPSGLNSLRGSNIQSAPETARTFVQVETSGDISQDPAFARETAAKSPWEQLDIEETALAKDEFAGLGHSADYPDWYGGKVEFRGKLQRDDEFELYKIVLERCTLGPSCRFTRRFGSKNFLRIKIPSRILHSSTNRLTHYFQKPFVIWGRVFRAFYAKEDTVFLFRTNEIFDEPDISPGHSGFSLLQFIQWHNPLEFNRSQAMAKWSARFALGLSNSYPGPMIAPENIGHEDDIISATGDDMTDGCGSSNKSTHMDIHYALKCDVYPVAVQFRLEGCKGMTAQRPDTTPHDAPKVWLRPSQRKIKYPPNETRDPAHLIMDILRTSYMRSPARVSPETIINLAENGVPHQVFIDLMKTSVATIVTGLTNWDGPEAMYDLWLNVERAGAVCFARRAREAAGEARVRGFGDRQTEEDEDEDEDEDEERLEGFDKALGQRSSAWWADQTSGCPSSLEETVMVLLDSGFTPQECPILREKLKQVVTTKVKTRTQNYRYDIELSAGAFVIPDRYGVLGPDEIQIKSSRRNLKNAEGLLTDIIVGDVLITRNPCKLPTDVRKVKAVEHPQLRDYVDVIVCTVQGLRRLLDFLAGGDYDGDTAVVIWTPEIVNPFKNADEKYSVEPEGLDKCFSRNNERVDVFLQRTELLSPEAKVFEIQPFLLGSLRDTSAVGQYSTMHDNAIYHLGYANPRTIRLAYKFCKVLDGAKTGLKILPETFKADLGNYHCNSTRGPKWKDKKTDSSYDQSNLPYLTRGKGNFIHGPCIMDVLLTSAKKECTRALIEIDTVFSPLNIEGDPHLLQPWQDAIQMAERGSSEAVKRKKLDLSLIALHVHAMYTDHRTKMAMKEAPTGPSTNLNGSSKRTSFTKLPIEIRQDIIRALSKKFSSSPRPEELDSIMDEATIARLRASYAYTYDAQMKSARGSYGWSRFPWDVAMRELCAIKARALGPHKTVVTGFYERFKLSTRR